MSLMLSLPSPHGIMEPPGRQQGGGAMLSRLAFRVVTFFAMVAAIVVLWPALC